MVRPKARVLRALALGAGAALVLAACGPAGSASPDASQPAASGDGSSAAPSAAGPAPGGTIYILTQAEQFDQTDPQRVYTGEDLAFFGATIYRSLTGYIYSADPVEGTSLTPDLATDLGTPNEDATSWEFTLVDGATFQDGSPVTCEDVKYGTSRTFATDIINAGPTYAIAYLDIPTLDDGSSAYKGPYSGEGQELFDEAVTCDGNTITFNLNKPVPDFNYTVTLGFVPVPEAADGGETYGDNPVSSGPYMIEDYTTGNGGKMILVRNPEYNPDSDPWRKAYPDRWEVHFGIDPKVMDQRLMQSAGEDAFAIQYGNVQPENLDTVFADPETPNPDFEGRATSDYDPYSLYLWIDVNKVSNVKIRQAMAVALDRAALRLNAGGGFAGELADGLIKPNIGQDYAPTGMWEDMFGQAIPDEGDPEFAAQLIEESGEAAPALTYDYPQTPVNDQAAAIVKASLELAGFSITPNPIEPGAYYSTVFTDAAHEFGSGGWGADWPNASTVIPPLLTVVGGWDLSRVDDADYNAQVDEALTELDRAAQALLWQELNRLAMERVYVIPTRFGLTQTIAGNKVQPTYQWPAYGSWAYGELYVLP